MENSYKYFENKECKYYPCHEGEQNLNCLFCYCPFYNLERCPGECSYIESNGKQIKDCTKCTFPHKAGNYEKIISLMSET